MVRKGLLPSVGFLICLSSLFWFGCQSSPPPNLSVPAAAPKEYLFCHWNVENFFDDKNDGRTGPGDKEYDALFAERPELLKQKLARLTEAILKMNGGKGPDILSIVEVESLRAAELLQQALNNQLPDKALHYENILMKEVSGG